MMICADRGEPEVVKRFFDNGAAFLLYLSGSSFGPANDEKLQSRSRENGKTIVFVHPCEFLVTGAEGEIRAHKLLGEAACCREAMIITEEQIGSRADKNRVCYYDWRP